MFPEIDAPIAVLFNSRFKAGFSFQLHFASGRDIHGQLIVEHDEVLRHEIMIEPELVLGQWRGDVPDHVILEHVAGT